MELSSDLESRIVERLATQKRIVLRLALYQIVALPMAFLSVAERRFYDVPALNTIKNTELIRSMFSTVFAESWRNMEKYRCLIRRHH